MNFIEAALFILFFAIISVPIATRFRLPLEIFLVIGSSIISLIPGLLSFQLSPIIVFNLFLPPILFYAAYFTSWQDFKLNMRPISLLAVGLVIFTMMIVGLTAHYLFPQLSWAECLLLGAIISPTDASAATTIIRKCGAPRRLVTILEGESLINDATALILFRFTLAAVVIGSFSFAQAIIQFFVLAIGGVALGLMIGVVALFLIQKIHSVTAETTLTMITAFACYIVGDHLGVSGVITTVVCGIYFGLKIPEVASSQTRITAKASWNTLIFIINGFAFTILGLELPLIVKNLPENSIHTLIVYGIIISIVVLLGRLVWVFSVAYLSRKIFPAIARKDPMPSSKILFILGLTGMRGIVSLAIALSLPYLLAPNTTFIYRDLFLFITYCVIVITLIIPTFILPIILYLFPLDESENKMKQEALARITSLKTVLEDIKTLVKKEKVPEEIFNDFLKHINGRLKVLETQLSDTPYSTLSEEYVALKKLTLAAIESERKTLLKLRKEGQIHDDVFHQLTDELDLEELRARTLRI